jgi:hypothetical protein
MKMKKLFLMATMLLTFEALNAQNTIAKGDAKLLEFKNATAKFIVPEGKTWVIYSAFSDYLTDFKSTENGISVEPIHIFIKSMNETVKTDLSKKLFGPSLFTSMELNNTPKLMAFPIILPEKTSFELILVKGFYEQEVGPKPYLGTGYLSIVEMSN